MGIVYVSRDGLGRISGFFANAQHGYATLAIDDQTLEVRAFVADTSIYRRAGAARLARQFRRRLARDPARAAAWSNAALKQEEHAMTTRVFVDPETPSGQLAAEAVDHVLEGKAMLARLGEILYAAIYDAGGGADLAAIEADLGLPSGQGQQAFDLINGARVALDDARIVALREIDQG